MSKLDEILRSRGVLPAKAANLANPSPQQPVQSLRDSQDSQDSQGSDSRLRFSLPIVCCAGCQHFQPRPGERPDGHCRRYATETWAAVPFACEGYAQSRAAGLLARRRQKVADMLRADPALRYAYDVQGASPIGQAAGPVSVLLGIRTAEGIITGKLTVPAEKWDMAAFIAYWDAQGRPS